MLSHIYDMLASPAKPFDDAVANVIVRTHLDGILNKLTHIISKEYPWFSSLIHQWLDINPGLNDMWHPAFSEIEKMLNNKIRPSNHLIATAALAMNATGAKGEWSINTDKPYVYMYGKWQTPACTQIGWSSAHVNSPLVCNKQYYSEFELNQFDHVQLAHETVFHTEPGINREKLPFPISKSGWDNGLWSDAYALLLESAPHYAHWALRLLNTIVPIDAPKNHQISASHWHRRGEILMSWRIRPDQLAEILVHEASHQHFFMANMLSQCDDGSDQTLYYSPVVNTKRPLSKILLAYHAFANVILFFHHCRGHLDQKDKTKVDLESKKIMKELKQLEQPLKQSNALTELGQRLWQPLSTQIQEALVV